MQRPFKKYKSTSFYLFISVLIILILKFLLTIILPLLDKTEARYAEIARIMSETNNWIVLQIDYGIPFLAKPPLSTWLSALSFEIFGLNEMAARLPSFLMSIVILILVGKFLKKERISFFLPAFVLLSMPEFLIHTGVVSTDSALALSVILIMLSFWKAIQSENRTFWGYLFFIAIGIGLLSKGPVVLIITAPPIFIWCLLDFNRFKEVFLRLPWILGILLTSLITIPWYVLMEQKSPGFFDYFIVGEHIKRFTDSEWKQDLYGTPQSFFHGMIWIFLMIFAFPWIQFVFFYLWKKRKLIVKDKYLSFFVLWLLWTPIFFTFSKNILHTYVLPVMVPISILVAYWWKENKIKKLLLILASIVPVATIIFFIVFSTGILDNNIKSHKYLLQNQYDKTKENYIPTYYWFNRAYSGQFYSKGKVKLVIKSKDIDSILELNERCLFVIDNKNLKDMPTYFKGRLTFLESNFNTSVFEFIKSSK